MRIALFVPLALLLSTMLAAQETANESVLADLLATDAAELSEGQEAAAWRQERESLDALIATWRAERERLRAALAEDRAELARLQQEDPALSAERERAALLAAHSSAWGEALRQALAELRSTMVPGVITQEAPAPVNAPLQDLDALDRHLEHWHEALDTISTGLIEGRRADGALQAVDCLRLGGVAAWWIDRERSQAGPLRMLDGEVQLLDCQDADRCAAIIEAWRIAEGMAQARVLVLPLPAQAQP